MSITLSSATAKANAAKADLTAPVAANNGDHGAANNASRPVGKNANSAQSDNSNKNGNDNNGKAGVKNSASQAGQAPAKPVQGKPAGQNTQTGPANDTADANAAAANASANAPVAAPLFAQLLNLADLTAADAAKGDGGDTKTDLDEATGSGSASAAGVLPAMITSMLNLAGNTPAPVAAPAIATGATGATGDAARADAISATSTLSNTATRLNLSAAGVAVTPAATPVADDIAAAATATPAPAAAPATPQSIYTLANSAAIGAVAQQNKAEAPAAPAAAADADTATAAVAQAPIDSRADAPAVVQAAPRPVQRSADAAPADTDTGVASAGATVVTVTKDDSRGTAATTPTGGNVGFTQTAAPATPAAAATVKLAGTPDQWQQPLRDALGDRLQVQLQRNNDHAVIRLEPPNMGTIEISIRHSAGALQVNLSANNSEVVRQLNTIGDSVRQDLSSRQFSDVAVTVSSSRAQSQAQSDGGRGGQQRDQDDGRAPGRALTEDDATSTFAMTDRE